MWRKVRCPSVCPPVPTVCWQNLTDVLSLWSCSLPWHRSSQAVQTRRCSFRSHTSENRRQCLEDVHPSKQWSFRWSYHIPVCILRWSWRSHARTRLQRPRPLSCWKMHLHKESGVRWFLILEINNQPSGRLFQGDRVRGKNHFVILERKYLLLRTTHLCSWPPLLFYQTFF